MIITRMGLGRGLGGYWYNQVSNWVLIGKNAGAEYFMQTKTSKKECRRRPREIKKNVTRLKRNNFYISLEVPYDELINVI